MAKFCITTTYRYARYCSDLINEYQYLIISQYITINLHEHLLQKHRAELLDFSRDGRRLEEGVASAMVVPVSRFEFEQIGLAITPLLANQPAASESQRARDQCQIAAVTLPVNLSFSFLSRVFSNLIDVIPIDS